ncbi:MAG TPA: class I SAM-dependent methyltransferase [Candidatus Binatia bacterium]
MDENRQHRMDALENSGIFAQSRQAFHGARYEFATKYVDGRSIADVACGLGYGSRILRHAGATTVMGIDLSVEAIHYAQFQHGFDGIMYMIADATRLPIRESSIDVITSFETIEHIPNTGDFLTELARILRPDGTLIVSSPNDWGLTNHHCHTWTPFEFMAEVAAFFKIESVWEQNSNPKESASLGIKHWSEETERSAECLIIVARQ